MSTSLRSPCPCWAYYKLWPHANSSSSLAAECRQRAATNECAICHERTPCGGQGMAFKISHSIGRTRTDSGRINASARCSGLTNGFRLLCLTHTRFVRYQLLRGLRRYTIDSIVIVPSSELILGQSVSPTGQPATS